MACYLLHFSEPISPKHTTRHYIGYAENLEARIEHHRRGTSKVRLIDVARERGIDFVVARVWEDGDKALERRLKNGKNLPRYCPICREEKR